MRCASVHASFPNGAGRGMRRTDLHNLMVEHAIDAGVHLAWGTRSAASLSRVCARRTAWCGRAGSWAPTGATPWCAAGRGSTMRARSRRFGFRRHYRVAPWSEYMEMHWGDAASILHSGGSGRSLRGVISRDRQLRLDQALAQLSRSAATALRCDSAGSPARRRHGVPALEARVAGQRRSGGRCSGSVDAITGEGLCLLFQQSAALAEALDAGDLAIPRGTPGGSAAPRTHGRT